MVPENVMTYIAGWFPLLSFIVPFVMYYYIRRAWFASIIVFGATLAALMIRFSMKFWSWLLLYLFICWMGCWAAHHVRKWRASKA